MKTNTFLTLNTATANVGVLVGLVFHIFDNQTEFCHRTIQDKTGKNFWYY